MRTWKADAQVARGRKTEACRSLDRQASACVLHDVRKLQNGPETISWALFAYFIVGMTNSAPSRMPVGKREVTAFMRV